MSESSAEGLLQRWRPYDSRRLTARELRVEALAACSFVVVAGLMAALLDSHRPFDPGVAAALIVSLALASRVRLHVGAGSGIPTQLVFVPMLFLLPPETSPACAAPAPLPPAGVAVLPRPDPPAGLLAALAAGWSAAGASLVFVAAGA